MTAETMNALGESNRRRIIDAMPGSSRDVAERTGIHRKTVDGIIRQLVRANDVTIARYQNGSSSAVRIAIFDEVGRLDRKPVVVPVTQYRTQWINGAHPCQQYNPWTQAAA